MITSTDTAAATSDITITNLGTSSNGNGFGFADINITIATADVLANYVSGVDSMAAKVTTAASDSGTSRRGRHCDRRHDAQETFLFSGTVRENLLLAKNSATEEEIMAALGAAGASELVESLPGRLDSELADNGANLSGGQRQRLAIPRAFLKDAPILIFDEATSALDGEAERIVCESISRRTPGKTVIVVAHRLNTTRQADKVILLDAGRVEAVGEHDELVRKSALYRSLFAFQGTDETATARPLKAAG